MEIIWKELYPSSFLIFYPGPLRYAYRLCCSTSRKKSSKLGSYLCITVVSSLRKSSTIEAGDFNHNMECSTNLSLRKGSGHSCAGSGEVSLDLATGVVLQVKFQVFCCLRRLNLSTSRH